MLDEDVTCLSYCVDDIVASGCNVYEVLVRSDATSCCGPWFLNRDHHNRDSTKLS